MEGWKIEPAGRTDSMVGWIDLLPAPMDVAEDEFRAYIDGRFFAKVLAETAIEH